MKQTSSTYKDLRLDADAKYEIQILQGNRTYGNDKIESLKIYAALFEGTGPQVGNTYAKQCEFTITESSANWPRMAKVEVRVRLTNGEQTSEWLSMGTYYTDERSEDKYGHLSITAFDGMLLTEQYWTDKIREEDIPASWPITARAWATIVQNAGLVKFANYNGDASNLTFLDDTVPLIGLNTASTVRDNLKTIAAEHGGNWQIETRPTDTETWTTAEELNLVPFTNMVDGQAAIAGIAIVNISVVGDGTIEPGTDYAYLGMRVQSFDSSPALDGITGVNLETEAGDVAAAGTTTGYVLNGSCEFSSSTGVAELCLSKLSGYEYKPFDAGNALLDPAADVGDLVIIDGRSYQMIKIDWNLTTWPTANIGAAYEQEVDHEYTILSPEAKNYRKSVKAANDATDAKLTLYPTTSTMESAIRQSASAIELSVSETYVTIADYETEIQNLQDQISGAITNFSGPDVPTLNNYPAEDWTTAEERAQHVGAVYLVTSDSQSGQAGQYYRFEQSGQNFAWVLVTDTALAQALADAAAAMQAAQTAIDDAAAAAAAAEAAQGTADEAKADAVAQAAQAQAAAIAAAAVDAANKANAALAAAQAYAEQQVLDFVNGEYNDDLTAIRGQLDQKIETYYDSNDPSSGWEDPSEHTGDLWYNTANQRYYRWDGTGWLEMTANPPTSVFNTINGKAQVFVSQPVPPYNIGDIWTQGANGDILRCVTAKDESGAFDATDWVLASKYTDDSSLTAFINGTYADMVNAVQKQLDGKAETYYQEDDPAVNADGKSRWDATVGRAVVGVVLVGSTKAVHEGDLWLRTTDNKTFYWNGTMWEERTVSDDLLVTITGKSQIFVSQPTPPYKTGDLWVQGETGDILRCKAGIDKSSEASYSASDWEVASQYAADHQTLTDFLGDYSGTLDDVLGQIDQKIQTWYQDSPDPATAWTTTEEKRSHAGDLWHKPTDGTTQRYTLTNGVYDWEDYGSVPPGIFDKIDGKAQVFVSIPNGADVTYNVGDLWVNANYTAQAAGEPTYSNEVLRCVTARDGETVTAFSINHWVLASKYTDDTVANQKRRVFTIQPTPPYDVGDLWANATYQNPAYNNELLRCVTAQTAAGAFNISHWQRADGAFYAFKTTDYENLKQQVDGKIDNYFYAYTPTLSNAPAVGWSDSQKADHVDDLFYDTSTGYVYRFTVTSGEYSWEQIQDQDIQTAMQDALDAAGVASGKRQVFISQPTTQQEYDVGDLWINEDGTLYTCTTAKAAGAAFNIDDWDELVKYADYKAAQEARERADAVGADLVTQTDAINDRIKSAEDSITEQATRVEEIGTTFRVKSDHAEISHRHNDYMLWLEGQQIKMVKGDETLTYWSVDEMYTPKRVRIPTRKRSTDTDATGGYLQIGGLAFQPRSNNHMSILWVGES